MLDWARAAGCFTILATFPGVYAQTLRDFLEKLQEPLEKCDQSTNTGPLLGRERAIERILQKHHTEEDLMDPHEREVKNTIVIYTSKLRRIMGFIISYGYMVVIPNRCTLLIFETCFVL